MQALFLYSSILLALISCCLSKNADAAVAEAEALQQLRGGGNRDLEKTFTCPLASQFIIQSYYDLVIGVDVAALQACNNPEATTVSPSDESEDELTDLVDDINDIIKDLLDGEYEDDEEVGTSFVLSNNQMCPAFEVQNRRRLGRYCYTGNVSCRFCGDDGKYSYRD